MGLIKAIPNVCIRKEKKSLSNEENLGRRRCSNFGDKLSEEIQKALERRNEVLLSMVLIGIPIENPKLYVQCLCHDTLPANNYFLFS